MPWAFTTAMMTSMAMARKKIMILTIGLRMNMFVLAIFMTYYQLIGVTYAPYVFVMFRNVHD